MSYAIFWTPEAEKTFNQNLAYLSEDWEYQVLDAFLDRVDAVIEQIRLNPLTYPLHKQGDVHKCVLNERMVLFFRIVDPETIHLLTFWNTHQDPDRLGV